MDKALKAGVGRSSLSVPGLPALVALLVAGLSLAGCGARKAGAPEFPFPSSARVDFAVGAEGLRALAPGSLPVRQAPVPASLVPRAAALSASASEPRLLAAINRFGLAFILPSADGLAFKVGTLALREMSMQSVLGLWPRGQGYLLELGRDPFTPGFPARSDFSPELLALDREGKATVLPRLGRAGEDLFALFPGPGGSWYAEFREENALGAKLRYATFASPESSAPSTALRRDLFEDALAPKGLDVAPFALRRAIAALGPVGAGGEGKTGGILVRARGAGGNDGYWLTAGRSEDAEEAFAWLSANEENAVIVLASGRGSAVLGGESSTFAAQPPLPGARLSGVAAIFPTGGRAAKAPGLMLVSWEEGPFPAISASGLFVQPLR